MSTVAAFQVEQKTATGWSSLGIAILICAALSVYASVVRDLATAWWTDPGASFGLVVLPVALWLAWTRRKDLGLYPAEPDFRGLVLLAGSAALMILGTLGSEYFLKRISLVLSITALLWAFWGTRRLQVMAFPLCLLATVIPLPGTLYNRISLPLQLLASKAAVEVIRFTDGTIYRDGNILHIPGLTLGVAEACSGLNSLSAIVVVALLMGFTHCTRTRTRVALLLTALPLAMLINVIRVTGTVWLAQASQEYALGFYHSFSGWLIFVVTSAIVYQLAKGFHVIFDR